MGRLYERHLVAFQLARGEDGRALAYLSMLKHDPEDEN